MQLYFQGWGGAWRQCPSKAGQPTAKEANESHFENLMPYWETARQDWKATNNGFGITKQICHIAYDP